jgi:hypothetical protein
MFCLKPFDSCNVVVVYFHSAWGTETARSELSFAKPARWAHDHCIIGMVVEGT